jgi:Glycosyl transferase family 2
VLEQITPVLLPYNEEENIGRTLGQLGWASDVVAVDSYSTDNTVGIARSRIQVRLFQRTFDTHAQQWNLAVHNSAITTEWILALDAEYLLTSEFIDELARLRPEAEINGYLAGFRYCVWGRPLRDALYPPVVVLFRNGKAHYLQDGHTHVCKLRDGFGGYSQRSCMMTGILCRSGCKHRTGICNSRPSTSEGRNGPTWQRPIK